MEGEEREGFLEVGKRESGCRERGWGKWTSGLAATVHLTECVNTVQRTQTHAVLCW